MYHKKKLRKVGYVFLLSTGINLIISIKGLVDGYDHSCFSIPSDLKVNKFMC